jgi:lipopolysaccharide transport system permease protein
LITYFVIRSSVKTSLSTLLNQCVFFPLLNFIFIFYILCMEYEIKPVGKFSLNLKELWSFNELFYFFTWRDVKVKYKQTYLGFAWAVLQPTLLMLVFNFVFGRLINQNINPTIPYPIFVYSGLMLWGIFSGGLQSAGNSMVNNANIIKKIYFPRLIIPLSSILVSVFDFLMTIIPFIGLVLYYQTDVDFIRLIWFFPLAFILIIISTFGLGCFLAALNVRYRDFRYVLPFFIQFLMFVTPVIYPIKLVTDEKILFLLKINPIGTSIELFRSIFDATVLIDWTYIGWSAIIAIFLLMMGIYYFRKTEAYFADLA